MEMSSEGEVDESLAVFKSLIQEEPPHVPAFFRSAQILADNDETDAARDFLRQGIDAARQQGDSHAAAEMSEMLADLGALGE
ncbi:MAG: tetratricopeptide repeat protein [Pseudomonadota bacterium]